jgi:predicted enzyme related to lactoylglutathione lyase
MERVLGIGGFFFVSESPDVLAQWYEEHLGITRPAWVQEAGEMAFAAFGPEHRESPYLGPAGWGLNFRVADLDAMVAQLRSAGIDVEIDPEQYEYGRFAGLHDPDGNAIQLWQPAGG